jgi:hypothetical protein
MLQVGTHVWKFTVSPITTVGRALNGTNYKRCEVIILRLNTRPKTQIMMSFEGVILEVFSCYYKDCFTLVFETVYIFRKIPPLRGTLCIGPQRRHVLQNIPLITTIFKYLKI